LGARPSSGLSPSPSIAVYDDGFLVLSYRPLSDFLFPWSGNDAVPFVQRVALDGTVIDSTGVTLDPGHAPPYVLQSRVICTPQRCLTTWTEYDLWGNSYYTLHAAIADPHAATLHWTEIPLPWGQDGEPTPAELSVSGSQFLILHYYFPIVPDPSSDGLRAIRIDEGGVVLDTMPVAIPATGNHTYQYFAAGTNTDHVLAWRDVNGSIQAVPLSASTGALGTPLQVLPAAPSAYPRTLVSTGNHLALLTDDASGLPTSTLTWFDPDGTLLGSLSLGTGFRRSSLAPASPTSVWVPPVDTGSTLTEFGFGGPISPAPSGFAKFGGIACGAASCLVITTPSGVITAYAGDLRTAVGGATTVGQSAGIQEGASITTEGGEAFVTWLDGVTPSASAQNLAVHLRAVEADGTPSAAMDSSTDAASLEAVTLASSPSVHVLSLWQAGAGANVPALMRVARAGGAGATLTIDDQTCPAGGFALSWNGSQFMVAWRHATNANFVCTRRLDAAGIPIGSGPTAHSIPTAISGPTLTSTKDVTLIAYQTATGDIGGLRLFSDETLVPSGADLLIPAAAYAAVVRAPVINGEFLVAGIGSSAIAFRRVPATGPAQVNPVSITSFATPIGPGEYEVPETVVSDGTWPVLLSHAGSQPYGPYELWARRLNLDGSLLDTTPLVVTTFPLWTRFTERVAAAPDGSRIFVAEGVADLSSGVAAARARVQIIQYTQPLGGACREDSDCTSSHCVDAVCCDTACAGGTSDCQACSIAAGAATNGTCGPRGAGVVCRAAANECDSAEVCDGTGVMCPADAALPNGTPCTSGVCTAGACTPLLDLALPIDLAMLASDGATPGPDLAEQQPDLAEPTDARLSPLPDLMAPPHLAGGGCSCSITASHSPRLPTGPLSLVLIAALARFIRRVRRPAVPVTARRGCGPWRSRAS
jgi:hypothetical protein